MTTTIDLICFDCVHFDEINGGCKAFPGEIPNEILLTNKHSKPLPNQGNDIVFEEIEDDEQ